MNRSGRPDPSKIRVRHLAEAEILADNPDISDIKLVEELRKRGIITTRQTVHNDRTKDLESMTLDDIRNTKSAMLKEIEELIQIAYARAVGGGDDALRAMDKYDKLFNTKAKVLNMFEQMKLASEAKEQPIINISIGKPKEYVKEKKKNEIE